MCYTLDPRSRNLTCKNLTLNKWVQHFSGSLKMSPHICTASSPSEGTVLWIQKGDPGSWFGWTAQQTIKGSYYFVILMPLSFLPGYNSRILIIAGLRSQFFWQTVFFKFLFPLSLLSCHTQCDLPKAFRYLLPMKRQCFQLLGSRSKYLLKWNSDLRQYLVPINIHLVWLGFYPSDKRWINKPISHSLTESFWSILLSEALINVSSLASIGPQTYIFTATDAVL